MSFRLGSSLEFSIWCSDVSSLAQANYHSEEKALLRGLQLSGWETPLPWCLTVPGTLDDKQWLHEWDITEHLHVPLTQRFYEWDPVSFLKHHCEVPQFYKWLIFREKKLIFHADSPARWWDWDSHPALSFSAICLLCGQWQAQLLNLCF